jgi:hypothetical protein
MPKTGRQLVTILDDADQEEWCRRCNAAVEAIALDFIGRSMTAQGEEFDITKVSDLSPKELSLELDDKRLVIGVEIDFFLEN